MKCKERGLAEESWVRCKERGLARGVVGEVQRARTGTRSRRTGRREVVMEQLYCLWSYPIEMARILCVLRTSSVNGFMIISGR